ncbi:MAG TPA: hypothetical protein VG204_19115 [Terriglobia bacterium]|nr:hypothetical protein [Terriglobia bacterium]
MTTEPRAEALHVTLTGLTGIALGREPEIALSDGFLLSQRTPQLGRVLDDPFWMGTAEKSSLKSVDCFFCLKSRTPLPTDQEANRFQNGLMALQIVKPVPSIGWIFQGTAFGSGYITVNHTERRPPMFAGEWAQLSPFDLKQINQSRALLPKVLARMETGSAEQRNSVILFQLALEHFHPLVKGFFAVMGLEAALGSYGRQDFRKKLCSCLGESTQVFPDWNSSSIAPPKYVVGDIALHLYTLRSKIAHGVDLRKAARDTNVPVDLMRKVELIEHLEARPYAVLLSEAALYILCLVLQKHVAHSP